uniref:Aquaporin NIP4-1 n=1 Tax=Zea mays TaxID=4577 RepID=A0A804N0V8_MAIZE
MAAMMMDSTAEKDLAGDGAAVSGHGQDLERSCHDQEPAAADGASSRGLAIGRFVREEMHGTLTFPMVCLVVALTVVFVLCWLGPAHFNPAVTVTFTVFGYLSWTKLPFYVAAQLAGSLLACLSANGVMEPRAEHFYGTVPMAGGDTRLPFLLELVASALLMVVIATAARGSNQTAGGLAIGAAVGALGLVIGPVSGGSMNPIRTLGPAIVLGRYTSVWIYLVAPVAGMLIGALCNRLVRRSDAIIAFLCGAKPRVVAPGQNRAARRWSTCVSALLAG